MDPLRHLDPDDIRNIPHPTPLLINLTELVLSIAAMLSACYLIYRALEVLP